MANLMEPLAKAQSGEYNIAYLRTKYDEEEVVLKQALEASEGERGWMGCLDLLEGETADAKSDDYIMRVKALGDANKYIRKDAETRAMMQDIEPLPTVKNFAPEKPTRNSDPTQNLPEQAKAMIRSHYQKMMESPDAVKFASMTAAERTREMRPGLVLAETKMDDYLPVLKASTFATATTGLLPADRIGMPYPLWTGELDYFNMMIEAGSIIRYMESRAETETNLATGDAQQRARAGSGAVGEIHEIDENGVVVELSKRSFGVMAQMALEDLRDNGRVGERTNRQLDIAMKTAMAYQILRGDNNNANSNLWNGIAHKLGDAAGNRAANIAAVTREHNSVAVLSSGNDREPIGFIDQLMIEMGLRGTLPQVLFLSPPMWKVIRDSQRAQALRNQGDDYLTGAPFGRVANIIPMCPTRHLAANTALLLNTEQMLDVVLGTDVLTSISEDFRFSKNAVVVRRTVYGNCAIMMPFAGFEITGTNNFQAAS